MSDIIELKRIVKKWVRSDGLRGAGRNHGLPVSLIRSFLSNRSPNIKTVEKIANAAKWSAVTLSITNSEETASSFSPLPPESGDDIIQVPIIGLASCGADGWSRLETTHFQAEAPKSIAGDKQAFAVISRGESMQPFGIYEGYLCFCSPSTEPLISDIVCIERKGDDGEFSLTIKKLGVIGHDAVEIIGYLPMQEKPSSALHGKQYQELFWETVRMKNIERLSVVTHIYTRPSAF